MSTKRKLPCLELLGLNYDVTGYYADARSVMPLKPLFSFNLANFDPNQDANAGSITIAGTTYYFPSNIQVLAIQEAQMIEQTTKSVTDFQYQLNVNTQAGGWYEGFSGSVEASFDASYRTSASFYSLTNMGLIQSYSMTLPAISDLKQIYLTAEAKQDLNGNMLPSDLVNKYGAFILNSGFFGGTLNYSQSISRYSVETQTAAALKVSANYMAFLNASVSGSIQTDNISTTEQSNGHFEAKGGSAVQLQQGYQAWAASLLAQGDFALVDFNKNSLIPIWLLADAPSRQSEIQTYVNASMITTPPLLKAIHWNTASQSSMMVHGKSSDSLMSNVLSDGTQVIVGVACSAKDKHVSKLALRVLNLEDNSITWVTQDKSTFNAADYQRIADIPSATNDRSVAVTGMGFTCTDHKVSAILLQYQMLNPADSNSKPKYLGSVLKTYLSADKDHQKGNPEVNFIPDPNSGLIMTGVGLRIDGDNFSDLKIWQSPLISTVVKADVVESKIEQKGSAMPVNLPVN